MSKRKQRVAIGLLAVGSFAGLFVSVPRRHPEQLPTILVNPVSTPEQLTARINQNQSRLRTAFLSQPSEKLAGVGIRSLTGGRFGIQEMHQQTDIMFFDSVAEAVGDDEQEAQGLAVSLTPRVDFGCGCCFDDVPVDQSVISDQDLALMSLVDDVRWLRVGYPNISGSGLACFAQKKDLEWLSVASCKIDDDDLRGVAALESLRYLDLSENVISGPGLRYLASLKNLETLYLSKNRLDGDALKHFPALSNLRLLNVDDTQIDGTGITNLEKLTRLEELSLRNTHVSDQNLSKLGRLDSLQVLDLNQTSVADGAMEAVARQSSLRSLLLSYTPVSATGLQRLIALKNLELIVLNGCNIGDGDLELLKPLLRTTNLKLGRTRVTPAGIIAHGSSSLRYLDQMASSRFPAEVSAKDANRIPERLPNLTTLHLLITPSNEPIDLRFDGLKQLRRMSISLPHDIRSITLEDLPALTEFRVLTYQQDRHSPSRVASKLRLKQLPKLSDLKIGVSTEIEMDALPQLRHVDLTLEDLANAGVSLDANLQSLNLRSDESLNPERLARLLDGVQSKYLSMEVPEFTREMSSAVNNLLPELERFYLSTKRFSSHSPFALSRLSKLKRMGVSNVDSERLEFGTGDLPSSVSVIELKNTAIGDVDFNGRRCRLKIKSAR